MDVSWLVDKFSRITRPESTIWFRGPTWRRFESSFLVLWHSTLFPRIARVQEDIAEDYATLSPVQDAGLERTIVAL
jgi:hypothetical protein